MPWCDHCDQYRAPTALNEDGTCPTCENEVDTEDMRVSVRSRAPWHFWVMVAALVLYLGWRAVQGVMWAISSIS